MNKKQFAEHYVMVNADKFDSDKLYFIKEKLVKIPEKDQSLVQSIPLKNPIITLILSLFFGCLAFDRFYLGDIGLGIIKIISVIFVIGSIWVILDWFLTFHKTKKLNYDRVMTSI